MATGKKIKQADKNAPEITDAPSLEEQATKSVAKKTVKSDLIKVKVTSGFLYYRGRFQERGKVLQLTPREYANCSTSVELIK